MKILAPVILVCLLSHPVSGQINFRTYSPEVQDSFDIYINLGDVDPAQPLRYFYYLDAGIKSGTEIRRQIANLPETLLKNKVFVGIAHTMKSQQKRRRDFIPPAGTFKKAHADQFYAYFTQRLIPFIEAKYGKSANRSLLGHSFGGLFVFYSLFRTDRAFNKFFALSPSLWVGNYTIFNQEDSFYKEIKSLPVFLYLSAGKDEKLNYILAGNRRMKRLLDQRQYQGLRLVYEEHPGKTHNSQVSKSVETVLHLPD